MHGDWFGSYGWIGMILYGLFWLAVLGGIIWLVVWAIGRSSSGRMNNSPMNDRTATGSSAKDIAQMRYARGEISREEYQQLLEDLSR
jgi:putative membrane protein